jgi:hypothetical protein
MTRSTLCFRLFRKKHTQLSRLYWTYILATETLSKAISGGDPDAFAVDLVGASFKRGMLPEKVGTYSTAIDELISRSRLHLLLVCAANLEVYLKDITFAFLAAKGHSLDHRHLDPIGKALGAPILGRSSLPDPLKYAESLFGISIGKPRDDWNTFYKLRCVLAHEGGVVTSRTLRDLPALKLPVGAFIGLTWPELFKGLEAADKIVESVDSAVSTEEVMKVEIAKELDYLKEAKRLPSEEDLWGILHDNYGFSRCKKKLQAFVRKEFY